MSVLTSWGILFAVMLIMAFLQLIPGLFSLFIHYSFGKYSRSRASDLATFFILGTETATIIIFLSIYFILCSSPALTYVIDSDIFAWVMAGVLAALAIIILFCYFKKGPGTKLFISRRLAHCLEDKARTAKTRSDAFILGLTAPVPELIFTLPLYLLTAITIMRLGNSCPERTGLIFLLIIATILPLIIIHILHTAGHTLADFTKFRFKNKLFFRFSLALLYLFTAILIILGVTL